MVDDFLPPRRPQGAGDPNKQTNPFNLNEAPAPQPAQEAADSPTPQLTRAQPFLRPGQLSTASNTSSSPFDEDHDIPELTLDDGPADSEARPPEKPSKKSPLSRLKDWWLSLSKKQKIIFWIVTAVVLLLIAAALYLFVLKSEPATQSAAPKKTTAKKVAPPAPTYSALTGLPVEPAVNQRPVTGVMVENSLEARPQSGLYDAGVVFEAIAEGGITRFLALYQDTEPDSIGPVRSVRPYYIQWGAAFNAAIAHVGGSPEALQAMKDWNIRDLDQFAGASYFTRVSSRYAPHNVYTSISNLRKFGESKGYSAEKYTGFVRNTTEVKPAAGAAPKAKTIALNISGALYNVNYDYDPATNSYLRKVGGSAHNDEKAGKQIAPKVVIGLVMPYSIHADRVHSVYQTFGSGKAYVFQGGDVVEATWHKADRDTQFTFTDAAGKKLKLNPGQTWLTAVGTAGAVTYAP